MKPIRLALIAASAALSMSASAAGIADKLEQLGEMTYLKVSEMRVAKRDGLLAVQVEVSNTDASNQQLYYRFKWLDESGFSVWGEEAWKPVLIYGKQKKMINEVAPTPRASDFRMEVQSPNNSANTNTSPSSNGGGSN
ncbi:MAG: YcfL family protein [Burkholderiales bacterium]|jgi:uncharacterized protein YcfL